MATPVGPQFTGARRRLIEELRTRGITDLAVLNAFDQVPRHLFVPTGLRHRAYEDSALPIGNGQTISQPWVHAKYLSQLGLTGAERVLEVGTGSGFQTALLAKLAGEVYSIERIAALTELAAAQLRAAGIEGVQLRTGDGTAGWPEAAPFDAILVGAGAPEVPQPLLDQLADGGRLIIPVGDRAEQQLQEITRRDGRWDRRTLSAVRFVPLVGRHGWEL